MEKRIPIGIEFYKTMIEGNYYYVDKVLPGLQVEGLLLCG